MVKSLRSGWASGISSEKTHPQKGGESIGQTDLDLPTCLEDLVKQIECMIRLLDLITEARNVASDGYREALNQRQNQGRERQD